MPHRLRTLLEIVLLPCGIYLALFIALTWPLATTFNTHLWGDVGDGFQNAWNLWWVNEALTVRFQSPFFTDMLHAPAGVSLVAHTLNLHNGLMAIPLLRLFSLVQTYNLVLMFTFVIGGWTAFLLCRHFSQCTAASIAGGFIFSFNAYHFAHAQGHLQVVSIEWIPLFLLFWIRFLDTGKVRHAVAAALTLFALMLCDYYHALYCVLAGFVLLVFRSRTAKDHLLIFRWPHLPGTIVFVILCLATCGSLGAKLLIENHQDPFWGAHEAWIYSNDLLALFIPGGYWRWGSLTEFYWSRIRGNVVENGVYLGWGTMIGAVSAVRMRARFSDFSIAPWLAVAGLFFALSLGPRLLIAGWELQHVRMPYSFAAKLFPPLQLGGMPVRMTIMINLAAAVLFSMACREWLARGGRARAAMIGLVALVLVEAAPPPMVRSRVEPTPHVLWLRDHAELRQGESVLDFSDIPSVVLYHQITHRRPLTTGYLARYPGSVFARFEEIERLARDGDFTSFHGRFGVRYLVLPADRLADAPQAPARPVFEDTGRGVKIYDLAP